MRKRLSSFYRLFTLKNIAVLLLLLVMIFVAIFIGYLLGINQLHDEIEQEKERTQLLKLQIKNITKVEEESIKSPQQKGDSAETLRLKKELAEIIEHESISAHHEYSPKNKKGTPPPSEKRLSKPVAQGNAKLVIIMDDVSCSQDVKAIRSVGLPLVMSFLPPTSRHSESAILAKGVSGCMVHLPLEAVAFNDEEDATLRISDSKETIAAQIKKIKKLYPAVRYVNNHTGSKFTADEDAMDRLLSVISENGLFFVDSRTTAQTKVKMMGSKYGLRYMGRDVFLDHHDGVENIKKQISEAVKIAKCKGTAIAIGHPRPDTIQALKESKAVLSQVKLVGIDKI